MTDIRSHGTNDMQTVLIDDYPMGEPLATGVCDEVVRWLQDNLDVIIDSSIGDNVGALESDLDFANSEIADLEEQLHLVKKTYADAVEEIEDTLHNLKERLKDLKTYW